MAGVGGCPTVHRCASRARSAPPSASPAADALCTALALLPLERAPRRLRLRQVIRRAVRRERSDAATEVHDRVDARHADQPARRASARDLHRFLHAADRPLARARGRQRRRLGADDRSLHRRGRLLDPDRVAARHRRHDAAAHSPLLEPGARRLLGRQRLVARSAGDHALAEGRRAPLRRRDGRLRVRRAAARPRVGEPGSAAPLPHAARELRPHHARSERNVDDRAQGRRRAALRRDGARAHCECVGSGLPVAAGARRGSPRQRLRRHLRPPRSRHGVPRDDPVHALPYARRRAPESRRRLRQGSPRRVHARVRAAQRRVRELSLRLPVADCAPARRHRREGRRHARASLRPPLRDEPRHVPLAARVGCAVRQRRRIGVAAGAVRGRRSRITRTSPRAPPAGNSRTGAGRPGSRWWMRAARTRAFASPT